jgi:hypothetical protein
MPTLEEWRSETPDPTPVASVSWPNGRVFDPDRNFANILANNHA